MRKAAVLAMSALFGLYLVGCGSGGGSKPPGQKTGEVSGRLSGVSDPSKYTITVDGRPVGTRPNANGEFAIRGLPPGVHTIGFVGPGGMHGAYKAVVVRRGQNTTIGDVEPVLGGQIAGIVTRMLESGAIEAVAGVEVTATSATNWAEPGVDDNQPIRVGRTDDPDVVVISAITNTHGSFLMEAVPPGGYDVACVVPGYEPQLLYVWVDPGSTAAADIRFYPVPEQGVGTVKGVVTGEGSPLEGALITLTTGSPWPVPLAATTLDSWLSARKLAGAPSTGGDIRLPPWIEIRSFSTLTDAAGCYSLNVPIGHHFIECWLDGWEWQGQEVSVKKRQTVEVNFDLVKWSDNGEPSVPPNPGAE